MCGINGVFAYGPNAPAPNPDELIAVRDHMAARGPDGVGAWWSPDRRIGFGHRRLSILDLSTRADQPMLSPDGDLAIVFNGEIYNHPALRRSLEAQGRVFRTTSDTEALLHLYALHGAEMTRLLRGMFAFAIYDQKRKGVFLARDGHGIKPLYVVDDGATLRFASQVKALMAGGAVSGARDPAGLLGFYIWGSVPEPYTLFKAVRQIPAGHSQWCDAQSGPQPPTPFVNIAALLAAGERAPVAAADASALVRTAIGRSVADHLLADVEVGLFLSGGVDSGALLGLMRDAGQAKVKAITLRFAEFANTKEDETDLARTQARHFGAEYIVRTVTAAEFQADLPAIMAAMDQPSIDGLNTWFVAKAAKEAGLKVALSGVGGDETFAGYPSFTDIPRWVGWLGWTRAAPWLGQWLRQIGDGLAIASDRPKATAMFEYGGSYEGAYLLRRALFLPHELRDLFSPAELRNALMALQPIAMTRAAYLAPRGAAALKSPVARVCALESGLYLRNQLLRDVDWAGMAHSLEVRTPFVDTVLTQELAPALGHFTAGRGKALLAAAPQTGLPSDVLQRPKTGFSVPMAHWLASSAHVALSKGAASRVWARRILTDSAFA
jgi:asparagine synthase (glutamine-hydrolysing)